MNLKKKIKRKNSQTFLDRVFYYYRGFNCDFRIHKQTYPWNWTLVRHVLMTGIKVFFFFYFLSWFFFVGRVYSFYIENIKRCPLAVLCVVKWLDLIVIFLKFDNIIWLPIISSYTINKMNWIFFLFNPFLPLRFYYDDNNNNNKDIICEWVLIWLNFLFHSFSSIVNYYIIRWWWSYHSIKFLDLL